MFLLKTIGDGWLLVRTGGWHAIVFGPRRRSMQFAAAVVNRRVGCVHAG